MNYPMQKAAEAYQTQSKETLTPRTVEYRVFGQVISRLHKSIDHPDDIIVLEEALNSNILLWNALAADVMEDSNPLPEQLRGQIVYLAQYMQHHTALIRKKEADVQAIIDINRMIMTGLGSTPVTQNAETKEEIGE